MIEKAQRALGWTSLGLLVSLAVSLSPHAASTQSEVTCPASSVSTPLSPTPAVPDTVARQRGYIVDRLIKNDRTLLEEQVILETFQCNGNYEDFLRTRLLNTSIKKEDVLKAVRNGDKKELLHHMNFLRGEMEGDVQELVSTLRPRNPEIVEKHTKKSIFDWKSFAKEYFPEKQIG